MIRDNVAIDVREVPPKRQQRVGRPALVNFDELRDVLRRADLAPISPAVRLANRLVAFSVQRIGNVVAATWDQFELDGDTPVSTFPREQMKIRDRKGDQRVPLVLTIAAELRALRERTGGKRFAFPSPSGKHDYVSRETIEKLYAEGLNLEGVHSPHAWRTSSFSTLARDAGEIDRDVIELLLDHVRKSQVIRTYNRAQRFAKRVQAAQWWDAQLVAPTTGAGSDR